MAHQRAHAKDLAALFGLLFCSAWFVGAASNAGPITGPSQVLNPMPGGEDKDYENLIDQATQTNVNIIRQFIVDKLP
jgi:hypothetical protein